MNDIKEFNKAYLKDIIEEQNNFGKIIAGSALLGATAGLLTPTSILGFDDNSEQQSTTQQIVQTTNTNQTNHIQTPPEPTIKRSEDKTRLNIYQCVDFIIQWEGSIRDQNGNHILYDDDVTVVKKRRWDGKGGIEGIKRFIKSCKR